MTQLSESELAAIIIRYNDAFNRRDVGAIMAAMTDDCVFENTYPPPDGERFEGQDAVGGFWERFFAAASQVTFEIEEIVACGDHVTSRWRYHWVGADGTAGYIRGVDIFRLREGKIAEKLSYVKG
jgi:ketosteroid isomerase-like protein